MLGADSPTLPVQFVEDAFQALLTYDVVIGPAMDGGYYLIGLGPSRVRIFDDIPWSTSRVLEATIARIRAASVRLALLAPWYDIDTLDDWHMARGHVAAMRQAGLDPGVPALERLMQEEG